MLPPWWPHKAEEKDEAQDGNEDSATGGAETRGSESEPATDPPKDEESATA